MDRHRVGSLEPSGTAAVIVSALAVALAAVAAIADQPVVLGAAAVAALVALALVIVRRSAPAPVLSGATTDRPQATDVPAIAGPPDLDQVGDAEPAGDAGDAEQYRAEAMTARADLLATLRHGYRAGDPAAWTPRDAEPADPRAATPTAPHRAPTPARTPADISAEAATSVGHDETPPVKDPADQDPLLDSVTGLFNQHFFEVSLPKRVSAARRGLRPLSVTAITVMDVGADGLATRTDPNVVAEAMIEVFREADTIAATEDGPFLVLLEDTPEAGAVWTLERLRRHLTTDHADRTMWAGVSCYPAYSFDADGLISQARAALESARQWQQHRIEIATHPGD